MKSELEKQYNYLVTKRICDLELSLQERADILAEFFSHAEKNYDNLCDVIYAQAVGTACDVSLWLDINGNPYLSMSQKKSSDLLLIGAGECPPFIEDIEDQIRLVLVRLGAYVL